jgi:uncharacterized protein YndB with AHSA1/START domain
MVILARSLLLIFVNGSWTVTEPSATRSVVTEVDFEYPVETVWRAMTDSEWLAVWFFPNDIQPVEGHKFTIWGRPIERWDGEFNCQVLAVEAPKMIRFRWFGGHEELKAFGRYMDTTVTWTLSPLPNGGTHFHFVQEGLGADPQSDVLYEVMVKGSESVLRSLTKRLPDLIEHGA